MALLPDPPFVDCAARERPGSTEADIDAAPLYRPGGLEHLAQLRERGVLGSPDQSA
ncbi:MULTISPECIES: hypothetical protein [Streptomyces]|uniref:Uncharacterized protein n=1 Tax=Streptomyces antimycoticus TaxID=68175 RepID=A0A499UYN9_9ACTN|nr:MULTISPECIES: hypothetical protein [Streptomyces]QTI90528.1 hypothetical protein AS97_60540 [Streptomyces sp. AgN23]WTA86704.1 hypothetical protein OG751_46695 [Streptomyces antimycoticus]WTB11136.1 hypothetical protein OG546_47855 [Streptomyces antimycoticus]BBJ47315.1 hypothetical protein SSPO_100330 [Streptomyces antimycoticus]